MLIDKKDYTRVFKLVTGEEIITKVTDQTDNYYVIQKPLQMVMGQRGFQFAPCIFMGDNDKTYNLHKSSIVIDAPPANELKSQYESAVTGIALPATGSIITS